MTFKSILRNLTVASAALLITAGSVYADKPEKGDGNSGKNNKEQNESKGKDKGQNKSQKDNGKGDDNYKSAGKDKNNGNDKAKSKDKGDRDSDRNNGLASFNFGSNETLLVREYYGSQAAKGNCPPGLAKKNNGCLPPGQAKKWQKGQALDSNVRYYDIPNELRNRLPPAPLNYKYVQMDNDLLLISLGTSIVVDAIAGIF